MWNVRLDEAQAGIKIARRNISNLRYVYDTTLRAESEEELKSLLMKVKEEHEKAGLKLCTHTKKIMTSNPIISWQMDGGTVETVGNFIFLGSKINHGCWLWLKPWNQKKLAPWKKIYEKTRQHIKNKDIILLTKVHQSKLWFLQSSCIVVWTIKLSVEELILLNSGVVEDSWESLGLQGDQTSPS